VKSADRGAWVRLDGQRFSASLVGWRGSDWLGSGPAKSFGSIGPKALIYSLRSRLWHRGHDAAHSQAGHNQVSEEIVSGSQEIPENALPSCFDGLSYMGVSKWWSTSWARGTRRTRCPAR